MKIASNVTVKNLITVFRKFAVEKALMLILRTKPIDILVQTMSIASNALQKVILIVLMKMKTAYCAIFKL